MKVIGCLSFSFHFIDISFSPPVLSIVINCTEKVERERVICWPTGVTARTQPRRTDMFKERDEQKKKIAEGERFGNWSGEGGKRQKRIIQNDWPEFEDLLLLFYICLMPSAPNTILLSNRTQHFLFCFYSLYNNDAIVLVSVIICFGRTLHANMPPCQCNAKAHSDNRPRVKQKNNNNRAPSGSKRSM